VKYKVRREEKGHLQRERGREEMHGIQTEGRKGDGAGKQKGSLSVLRVGSISVEKKSAPNNEGGCVEEKKRQEPLFFHGGRTSPHRSIDSRHFGLGGKRENFTSRKPEGNGMNADEKTKVRHEAQDLLGKKRGRDDSTQQPVGASTRRKGVFFLRGGHES